MQNNYQILLQKLNEFIRKYYQNLIIRGSILFGAIFILFSLLIFGTEYFGHFNTTIRTALFYCYLSISIYILAVFIVIPLLKLNRIGNTLSNEQAAEIIGNHFAHIQDKLLNTLQLKKLEEEASNKTLIQASINQRIELLKPISFTSVIEFRTNRKYLKYLAIPLLLLFFILIQIPEVITGPVVRLVNHRTYYAKPLPYSIQLLNKKLQVIQHEDFVLKVSVEGKEMPDQLFVESDGIKYKMQKKNTSFFEYTFTTVQKSLLFQLSDDAVYVSSPMELQVLPKPVLLGFDVRISYPSYLQKPPETLKNNGDLTIPDGSRVTWTFTTKTTEKLALKFANASDQLMQVNNNRISYSRLIRESGSYRIRLQNSVCYKQDSVSYFINVIPDALPLIEVSQQQDSVLQNQVYFKGTIRDDYGFTKLLLVLESKNKRLTEVPVKFDKSASSYTFYFDYDFSKHISDKTVDYYFQVWDNDAVNGFKSAKSTVQIIKLLSEEELEQSLDNLSENLESSLEKMQKQSAEISKKAEELARKLNENKNLNWQEQKELKKLTEQFNSLQKKIEQFKEDKQMKELYEDKLNENALNPEIQEKLDQLNKLIEELLTPEMKAKMQELQRLMEQFDKEKIQDALKDIKNESKDLEKALDRNLELFKQLEFEKKLAESIEKLEQIKKKQEEALRNTNKDNSTEKKTEQQDAIKKEFENLEKNINELQQKNKELEDPVKMENPEQLNKEINSEMQQGLENIQNKKDSKAQQNQQKALEKMEQLQQQLEKTQEEIEKDESEQIEDLRQLLENLIKTSFNQEELMNKFKQVSPSSALFQDLVKEQKKIKDDVKLIEDSLMALSKRQPAIESIVLKELNKINNSIAEAISGFQDIQSIKYSYSSPLEKKSNAVSKQQLAMTSMNNLALMLSETLEQAQNKKNSKSKSSKKNCKNPKNNCSTPSSGKKQSMKSMQKMQEELNKQIESMKGQQGQKKPNGQSMSKELARMAYEQSMIRQQLMKMRNEVNGIDQNMSNQLNKMIENMNKTEKELINKNITNETIQRQKDILTRMLESQKSDMFQEMEQKRESKEQKNDLFSNPFQKSEYNRLKREEREKLNYDQPNYNNFYKNRINEYFIKFDK